MANLQGNELKGRAHMFPHEAGLEGIRTDFEFKTPLALAKLGLLT